MTGEPAKKLVLIVEDTQELADVVRDVLQSETDYEAVTVADGRRALELVRTTRPHLILLDVSLPGLRGPEVYDRLQADPTTRGIPVLFMTANLDAPDFRDRAFPHVLPKPFDLDALLDQVHALV